MSTQHKKDRRPEQAKMRLIRLPFVPTAADVSITPMERLKRKIGDDVRDSSAPPDEPEGSGRRKLFHS
jgi:hypothetical protein